MPTIEPPSYRAPALLRNGHAQTLFASLARRVAPVTALQGAIDTPDGDFLDVEFCPSPDASTNRTVIITHGLEGSARQPYAQGMARAFAAAGWGVVAWHLRSCGPSGPNRLPRFYHSGATDDLQTVIDHTLTRHDPDRLALVGFSLGGNMTLKLLGDIGSGVDSRVRCAVAFSVPCDLRSCSRRLAQPSNRVYMERFLRSLRAKARAKSERFPGIIDPGRLDGLRSFLDFDEHVTAPLHGFAGAEDYWERASSKPVLRRISIPTLLVNARDDPMLGAPCFPTAEADDNPNLHFEAPGSGGHVGFVAFNRDRRYWSESRAVEFAETRCPAR